MKKLLLVFSLSLVIGVALVAGCAGGETIAPAEETATQIIEDITPQEAFTLMQDNESNPSFIILDVRTAEEFASGYIENAINIDYYSETFRDELNKLDKDKSYLIYCHSGNRSGKALDIMAELNFREVYNILGGIIDWQAEELPTAK